MIHKEQAIIIEQIDARCYWVKTNDGSIKKLRISGKQYMAHQNLPVGKELTIVVHHLRPEEVRMAHSNRF